MLMKKLLQSWYFIYTILFVVVGVIAFFCKDLWYIPATIFAIIFHFSTYKKIKWEIIDLIDAEGFPAISDVPSKESKPLFHVLKLNTVLGFAGIIACIIDFLV